MAASAARGTRGGGRSRALSRSGAQGSGAGRAAGTRRRALGKSHCGGEARSPPEHPIEASAAGKSAPARAARTQARARRRRPLGSSTKHNAYVVPTAYPAEEQAIRGPAALSHLWNEAAWEQLG